MRIYLAKFFKNPPKRFPADWIRPEFHHEIIFVITNNTIPTPTVINVDTRRTKTKLFFTSGTSDFIYGKSVVTK